LAWRQSELVAEVDQEQQAAWPALALEKERQDEAQLGLAAA
jgi:hypothetical protein